MITKEKFRVRINYKSGISEELDVYEFSVDKGLWTWKAVNPETNHPLIMGVDNVESVWQIGYTPAQEI